MPTPMPISAVTCGANDGTSKTLASRLTKASPIPMPNNAVMIGMPIASNEPNAINRMMTAARIPIASLAGCVCSVNIEPPSSTCKRGEFASLAMVRIFDARSRGTSFAWTSKRISAYAIFPSRATKRLPAGSYGDVTLTTCGSLRNFSKTGSISFRTPGELTSPGPFTLKTSSPVSPFRENSRLRTLKARSDSVPGSEKVLRRSPPTVWPSTLMTTSAMTQPTTTRRRRR